MKGMLDKLVRRHGYRAIHEAMGDIKRTSWEVTYALDRIWDSHGPVGERINLEDVSAYELELGAAKIAYWRTEGWLDCFDREHRDILRETHDAIVSECRGRLYNSTGDLMDPRHALWPSRRVSGSSWRVMEGVIRQHADVKDENEPDPITFLGRLKKMIVRL